MRRTCTALVRDLEIDIPVNPDDLVERLCARMGERLGQPVHYLLVRFPPESATGLWIDTGTAHYLLCERDTSGWHRVAITAHEFWHVEAGHGSLGVGVGDRDLPQLLLPSLDPSTVARIVAQRTYCSNQAEQEAEFFSSLLMAKVSRWLPRQSWSVPDHAAALVDRLETTLGHRPARRQDG